MLTYDYMLRFKFKLLLELERNIAFSKAPNIELNLRIETYFFRIKGERDHAGF